jgi:hypothetical protein
MLYDVIFRIVSNVSDSLERDKSTKACAHSWIIIYVVLDGMKSSGVRQTKIIWDWTQQNHLALANTLVKVLPRPNRDTPILVLRVMPSWYCCSIMFAPLGQDDVVIRPRLNSEEAYESLKPGAFAQF